ncbi:hypothetical protein V6000_000697 [Aspergillus fumigatus]
MPICCILGSSTPAQRPANETDSENSPLDHAERGRGIILASISSKPPSRRRVFNRVPTRRSFVPSYDLMNCLLHRLRACSSVIEPLSDWTLKYISINCTHPPGFKTLANYPSQPSATSFVICYKANSPGLTESAPSDVCEVGRPPGSVDAGRKETRVNKVEMVGGKGESTVEVIDLIMKYSRACHPDSYAEICQDRLPFSRQICQPQCVQRVDYDHIHPAIWILRSHIDYPRPSAITTVEYSAKSRNRWKNQSTVEDPDEHSVLEVEAFCFFLIMDG